MNTFTKIAIGAGISAVVIGAVSVMFVKGIIAAGRVQAASDLETVKKAAEDEASLNGGYLSEQTKENVMEAFYDVAFLSETDEERRKYAINVAKGAALVFLKQLESKYGASNLDDDASAAEQSHSKVLANLLTEAIAVLDAGEVLPYAHLDDALRKIEAHCRIPVEERKDFYTKVMTDMCESLEEYYGESDKVQNFTDQIRRTYGDLKVGESYQVLVSDILPANIISGNNTRH